MTSADGIKLFVSLKFLRPCFVANTINNKYKKQTLNYKLQPKSMKTEKGPLKQFIVLSIFVKFQEKSWS
jgi:hypothetical protein